MNTGQQEMKLGILRQGKARGRVFQTQKGVSNNGMLLRIVLVMYSMVNPANYTDK